MKFSEYAPDHKEECLAIFDNNTSLFFAIQEKETFYGFLNKLTPPYHYYIVRDTSKQIVACGGVKFETSNHFAMLRWDMVASQFHNQNIGTFLTLSRLFFISQNPDVQMVNLHTSQHTYQFYERLGFVAQHVTPNGIVEGMDEYYMELKFSKEIIQKLKSFAEQESLA